ncbi:MAG TPA: tail fiber protein [Pyrinomonadaceae bacterium]|nr:tail fiber protein [Pyrinomonadaceae bacterium]
MADPFVAEIRIFPFNFAPKGWAFCDGQLLPLSQNTALFSLLGTTYGGDGKSNFALPNMQGNAPMHPGQGPGLSLHDLGETGGSETVSLLESEIPSHSHAMKASSDSGDQNLPVNNGVGNMLAKPLGRGNSLYITTVALAQMNDNALTPSGGDQPHNNMQPYLTLNFCIALQGVFPPRT